MDRNRVELTKNFTTLVLDTIEEEQKSPTRPNGVVTTTLSVRLPIQLKRRLKKAAKKKGVHQTDIVTHSLRMMIANILNDAPLSAMNGNLSDLLELEA